jgi:hypothetical protein
MGQIVRMPHLLEGDAELARRAKRLYDQRRARDEILGPFARDFGEPAWDLLLDLFHSQVTERPISLSSGCIASCAPTSTTMRHIRRLERNGLLLRSRDPEDGRRWLLRFTERGWTLMRQVLSAHDR